MSENIIAWARIHQFQTTFTFSHETFQHTKAISVAKFTHLQTFEYEIMNDIHNKNECGVGRSIKKNE